jgi:L-rhamnose mutarotase
MKKRYCLALDLKDDPKLISEYKQHHAQGQAWPEITKSIRDSGIEDMEIYLLGTRMFMIMDVNEHFSFEAKAKSPQPKGSGMGSIDVEIPATSASGGTWRKVDVNG